MKFAGEQTGTRDLWSFCRHFLTCCGQGSFQDSELLASEFLKYFGLRGVLRLTQLEQICRDSLGLSSVQPYSPLGQERGTFVKLGKLIKMFYKRDDWEGSQEFTIAHELREILGAAAKDVDPSFVDAKGEDLEIQADAFAAALLMERSTFLRAMTHCGLDPIYLHNSFNKSYIGVVSRMATILDSIRPKGHFWSSVLEDHEEAPEGYFKAGCFHRSPRYKPKARYQVPNFLFPKRGQLVPVQGPLQTAFRLRHSVFIKKLAGLDFWDQYCLSVMIRPVVWSHQVAKLIVIAIPEGRVDALKPQIKLAHP